MTATLRQVRVDVAAAVDGVIGGRAHDKVPSASELPCHVVNWPTSIEHNVDGAGDRLYRIAVATYVSLVDPDHAQDLIDQALVDVQDALETHNPAVWSYVHVTGASSFQPAKVGNTAALTFDTNVEILA